MAFTNEKRRKKYSIGTWAEDIESVLATRTLKLQYYHIEHNSVDDYLLEDLV